MKTCGRCKIEKPRSDFSKRKITADGLGYECKACSAVRRKAYTESGAARDAVDRYRKTEKGKATARKYEEKHHDRLRAIRNEWRRTTEKGQEGLRRDTALAIASGKRSAHQRAYSAIRYGKLEKKPCEVCGSNVVHAHHDDYSKPLDVRWLCPKHHSEHHHRRQA